MKTLHLTLLGTPQILLDNQPLAGFATNKAKALLFYLAVTAHTDAAEPIAHSRDALAALLWSELTDTQAKQNLRSVLPDLRRLVGDYVQIERQTVTFDRTQPYWLDIEVLRRSLAPTSSTVALATRQAAVDLYQDEFLHGFYVQDAPLFEAWVLEQRESLHILVVNALTTLVGEYAQQRNGVAALAANRRLLRLEPWSEPAHRQQMLLLVQSGERAAALAQYETCRRMLAEEFRIEPLPETTALYEQIRAGKDGDGAAPSQVALPSQQPAALVNEGKPPAPEHRVPDRSPLTGGFPVVGHNLPQPPKLYGRQAELALLYKWIGADGCRLVGILGIGGQGKTALASALVHTLAEPTRQGRAGVGFQRIIWQSLLNAPPFSEVMQAWFAFLSDQTVASLPVSLELQFSQLFAYLQRQRCLLILDNLESILQQHGANSGYQTGYEAYGQLIRRLATGVHQSCLLFTSRERPQDLDALEEDSPTARILPLAGLPADAGGQMLKARGVADSAQLAALVQHYSGNPLALKLVAETIRTLFDGDIAAFLQAETLVFDTIRQVLDQQFAHLTQLELELMNWFAIVREPVAYTTLRALLAQPPNPRLVLEAVRALQRRSLLEKYEEGFGLQNVVLEYVTDRLVDNIVADLLQGHAQADRGTQGRRAKANTSPPPCASPPTHHST